MKKDLITRLNEGPIMCAEGYLFAMERRGYLSAGPFVPEVVLEHPEVVTQLHREFIRAGSDVVQAFTYYGHREKLRLIACLSTLIHDVLHFMWCEKLRFFYVDDRTGLSHCHNKISLT